MNDDDLLNDVVALELKTSKKMASVWLFVQPDCENNNFWRS